MRLPQKRASIHANCKQARSTEIVRYREITVAVIWNIRAARSHTHHLKRGKGSQNAKCGDSNNAEQLRPLVALVLLAAPSWFGTIHSRTFARLGESQWRATTVTRF